MHLTRTQMNSRLPGLTGWILKKLDFYNKKYAVYDDLEEEYCGFSEKYGVYKAFIWIILHTVMILGEYIFLILYRSGIMFKNYFKISYRNIVRNKGFSFINIFGLITGITCFIVIILFIQYEYSFDKFHENYDNIYRVTKTYSDYSYQGKNHYASTMPPLAPALKEEFPEVINAARIMVFPVNALLQKREFRSFENGIYADDNFLKVFSYGVAHGDRNTALTEPNSIMLSVDLANKIFKNADPIGQVIRFRDEADLKVTGVFENLPGNTHLRFDFLISLNSYPPFIRQGDSWYWMDHHTYIILHSGTDREEFSRKIDDLFARRVGNRSNYHFDLQPLSNIHFETHYNYNIAVTIDRRYIYMYTVTAFLILMISCINFMNLSTARSLKRTKEIGIRKVAGANRKQLFSQYLSESLIQTLIAAFVALFLSKPVMFFFNRIIDRQIEVNYFDTSLLFLVVSVFLCTGIVAGLYPAVILSSFSPLNAIKGKPGKCSFSVRNGMVVVQFGISILLIVCTLVVQDQLRFIRDKDIGYNREHVVVIPVRDEGIERDHKLIKDALLTKSGVLNVSCSGTLPLMQYGGYTTTLLNDLGEEVRFRIVPGYGDFDFIDLFELEVVRGRKFSEEYQKDHLGSVILNETALETLGWNDPFSKEFDFSFNGRRGKARVVGIIKDTHFWSMHTQVEPYILFIGRETNYISVKISPFNISKTMSLIEETYKKHSKAFPFDYFFLDDKFNQLYRTEEKLGAIFSYFSCLAIFIACLGLFGLIAFTVESKTKEIGIRKVLGSNEFHIVSLISSEFFRLILVANIIAWPIAFFIMDKWLEKFAYKINISPGIFILSTLTALLIAFITISFQTIKAAVANPVESLKYE